MKCSIKTTEAEKEQKTKIETEQGQQIENSNVVDINPTISIINLNINGLNAEQIKKQNLYVVTLNTKAHVDSK